MKLAVVFPVLNQFPLAQTAIDLAIQGLSDPRDVQLVVIDNGSSGAFYPESEIAKSVGQIDVIRHEKSIGVYPTFWDVLKFEVVYADIIAFFHSDLLVVEKGWDARVLAEFERNPKLGLLGFIGSNEIDSAGGRGLGTTSNFQGLVYHESEGGYRIREHVIHPDMMHWQGSPGAVHGAVNSGFTPATVVDGCAMIFRREALEQVPQRPDFPPHHFYDRLLSCEVRERGWDMGVLGIACDHISGQTVNQEPKYDEMAKEWAEAHGLTMEGVHNWDSVLYREAERQWLKEYRDEKRLVPCKL